MSKDKVVRVRMSEELLGKIDNEAEQEERSRSNWIRKTIKNNLKGDDNMQITKSIYITGQNGTYMEAEFENGKGLIIDTIQGFRDGNVDQEIINMDIKNIFEKYGEGEEMDWEETGISTEYETRKEFEEAIEGDNEKKYYIDFGSFDDNRNFDWDKIKKVMLEVDDVRKAPPIDLGDIEYKTRKEAEKALEKISDYVDISIVSVIEE